MATSHNLNIVLVIGVVLSNGYLVNASSPNVESELCGPRNLTCVAGQATCVNNTCACDESKYVWGDGYFACYKKNEVAAEVRNDPFFTTFNNYTFSFPFPCRYLLTHVRQELKDDQSNAIGTCEFKIHSFNQRSRGKIFVHGVDIAARIRYDNGTIVERSVAISGEASSDVANMSVTGVQAYRPDGSWSSSDMIEYDDNVNNIHVQYYEDGPNKRYVFEIRKCGLKVTFTPYDVVERRKQVRVPGLAVSINSDHHPVWLSTEETIGLSPDWHGEVDERGLYDGQTLDKFLIARAYTTSISQNHSGASDACPLVKSGYKTCKATSHTAFVFSRIMCAWVVNEASFIKCISDNGFDYVDIYARCLGIWCEENTSCSSLVSDMSVCKHLVPNSYGLFYYMHILTCRN